MPTIERLSLHALDEPTAMAGYALMAATWPQPGSDPAAAARDLLAVQARGEFIDGRSTWHLVREPGARDARSAGNAHPPVVVLRALAELRPRLVDLAGTRVVIGALASVCTAAAVRREGLGSAVVADAFARATAGVFPWIFFQTSERNRPFYERLGAVRATNPVVNSLAPDPAANPFWDEITMRFPAREGWPAGVIDLLGPGY